MILELNTCSAWNLLLLLMFDSEHAICNLMSVESVVAVVPASVARSGFGKVHIFITACNIHIAPTNAIWK